MKQGQPSSTTSTIQECSAKDSYLVNKNWWNSTITIANQLGNKQQDWNTDMRILSLVQELNTTGLKKYDIGLILGFCSIGVPSNHCLKSNRIHTVLLK